MILFLRSLLVGRYRLSCKQSTALQSILVLGTQSHTPHRCTLCSTGSMWSLLKTRELIAGNPRFIKAEIIKKDPNFICWWWAERAPSYKGEKCLKPPIRVPSLLASTARPCFRYLLTLAFSCVFFQIGETTTSQYALLWMLGVWLWIPSVSGGSQMGDATSGTGTQCMERGNFKMNETSPLWFGYFRARQQLVAGQLRTEPELWFTLKSHSRCWVLSWIQLQELTEFSPTALLISFPDQWVVVLSKPARLNAGFLWQSVHEIWKNYRALVWGSWAL